MKIALIAALSAAVLGVGAVRAVDSIGGSSEPASPAASTTEDTTTTEDRTTTTEDKTRTSEERMPARTARPART